MKLQNCVDTARICKILFFSGVFYASVHSKILFLQFAMQKHVNTFSDELRRMYYNKK